MSVMYTQSLFRAFVAFMLLGLPLQGAASPLPPWPDRDYYHCYLKLCRLDRAQWSNISSLAHHQDVFAISDPERQPDPCLVDHFLRSEWRLLIESLDADPSSFDRLASAPNHRTAFRHHQDMGRLVVMLGHAAVSYHHSGCAQEVQNITTAMFRILAFMANSPTSFPGAASTVRASIVCLGVLRVIDGTTDLTYMNAWRITSALERLPHPDTLGLIAALSAEADYTVDLAKSIADPDREIHPDLQPPDADTHHLSTRLRSDAKAASDAVDGIRAAFAAVIESGKKDDIARVRQLDAEIQAGQYGPLASLLLPRFQPTIHAANANRRLINLVRPLMQLEVARHTATSIRDVFVPKRATDR